ncbi:MAG: class I SAM-dependent methyltransferase, partial [Desulfobacteraceae bacterium]|nr:class I SAM-dependent methyltransferase [Desulfobacteraceae bacterium]
PQAWTEGSEKQQKIETERNMNAQELKPGDPHYQAYVGPPEQYDFMGASQFRLLTSLGLRAGHNVLDFGCGSLRAGRFLITYLDQGHYFGIEPNAWLIQEAVKREIGDDLVRIKKPCFDNNSEFAADVFGINFDYILAQSIFSHAGPDLVRTGLQNFRDSLQPRGLIAATFVEGDQDCDMQGWAYPDCVTYRQQTVHSMAQAAGLFCRRIPWYHPRQAWYVLALNKRVVPSSRDMCYLCGAVLNDPEFTFRSEKEQASPLYRIKAWMKKMLPLA